MTSSPNTSSSSSSTSSSTRNFVIILFVLLLGILFLFSSTTNTTNNTSQKSQEHIRQNNNIVSSSSSFHLSGSQNLSSYISSPLLEPKCLSYKERYQLCMDVKSKLKTASERRFYFSQFLRQDSIHPRPKEVALYRIHRIKEGWSDDFWLNVCSWISETTGLPIIPVDEMMSTFKTPNGDAKRRELYELKYPAYKKKARDTFLYALGGHEDSVPAEFQQFVKIHLEDELPRIFSKPLYSGGYTHGGDLAAGLFMKVNPQYTFCWIFESDTRFAGTSWHRFLTMARVAGKTNIDHTPTAENNGKNGIGKEAHLIWFYPRMINHGYGVPEKYSGVKDPENPERSPRVEPAYKILEREYWNDAINQRPAPSDPTTIINKHLLNFRKHYFGFWKYNLTNTTFNAAFVPACGISSVLTNKIWDTALTGNGHMNQEIMAPLVAQFHGLKMTSLVGLKIPKYYQNKKQEQQIVKKSNFFPFQFYFGFSRRKESAPMYVLWKDGESISEVAALYQGIHTYQFRNSDCLEDVLMHPVKF